MIADSTSTWSLKKITWASIKTALLSLFIPKVATPTINALGKIDNSGSIVNSNVINDSNGNTGFGVTPNAWGNINRVIDLGTSSSLVGRLDGVSTELSTNYWRDSSNVFKYIFIANN